MFDSKKLEQVAKQIQENLTANSNMLHVFHITT
jgi:hypothetical protein